MSSDGNCRHCVTEIQDKNIEDIDNTRLADGEILKTKPASKCRSLSLEICYSIDREIFPDIQKLASWSPRMYPNFAASATILRPPIEAVLLLYPHTIPICMTMKNTTMDLSNNRK